MKITLLFCLLFFSCSSFAQITLEHQFNDGAVTRIKLEYSGEKYYTFKKETNELMFFNEDHSFWKTIILSAPKPNEFTSTIVFHVSEAKINSDANIEIVFGYYNDIEAYYESKVVSEDGTVLLTIPYAAFVYFVEIEGLSSKLITENLVSNTICKVYSVPELELEHTYTDGNVKRIKLENSGQKYYLLDNVNQKSKIYNQDHSLWKTIHLPKPENATYAGISFVSENQINADELLVVGYVYYTIDGPDYNYAGKLINENDVELLTVPKAFFLNLSSIEGLDNKLMAYLYNGAGKAPTSNVYQLSSLLKENAYESVVTRVKLENSGEKYYTSYKPNQAVIYNDNHTVWKTISLPIPTDFLSEVVNIDNVSETLFDLDPLLEFSYVYKASVVLDRPVFNTRVINENGTILATLETISQSDLSRIPDLKNKFIGYVNNYNSYYYRSEVYALETLSTNTFNAKSKVVIAPNPSKNFISINSLGATIKEATIYNLNGALVSKEKAQNITKINVENLPIGIYIVNLTDFNNQKSTHKITILH